MKKWPDLSHPPHKGVALVWENADFHDGSEGGEGLSHQLFWGGNNQRGRIRSDPPLGGWLLTLGSPTCEPRADPPAVHGAVAGAGLVHHVVEAQLLGVACTQKTEGWLSGSWGRGGGSSGCLHSYALS